MKIDGMGGSTGNYKYFAVEPPAKSCQCSALCGFNSEKPGIYPNPNKCKRSGNTVDGQIPAPPKNPRMMIPMQTNKRYGFPWFLRWCELDLATIHSSNPPKSFNS